MVYSYYNKKVVKYLLENRPIFVEIVADSRFTNRVVAAYYATESWTLSGKSVMLPLPEHIESEILAMADSICPLQQWNP